MVISAVISFVFFVVRVDGCDGCPWTLCCFPLCAQLLAVEVVVGCAGQVGVVGVAGRWKQLIAL